MNKQISIETGYALALRSFLCFYFTHSQPRTPAERKKKSKFQRTPNALPPLDITPLFTLTDAKTEEPGERETTTRRECQAHRPQRRPGHRLQRKAWR